MLILILGLVVFLAPHILTTQREARSQIIESYGAAAYKNAYSIVSIIGFALICWGFSRYRAEGMAQLWTPPAFTRHLALSLMWFAFVALVSGYGPAGKIRGWLRHPMLAAVKIWALAHLLANGDLGGLLLFGSLLAYAVYDRICVKKRGDMGAASAASFNMGDAIALGGGTLAYVAMLYLHPLLIGVAVLR